MIRFTLCYDISQTKKRTRLVKILEEFGERIQYSVFEFYLTKAQHVHLMQRLKVKGFLEKDTAFPNDSVTMYYFDKDPKDKIVHIGKSPVVDREDLLYV